MTGSPQELAENVRQLASFPEVALRLDDVLADDSSSARDIANLIESDPAISAALLRIANSAAFGLIRSVDDIETAVRVVGSREIRDLTFGIAATETFKGMPNELITVEDFWKHSLYCASVAQNLANAAKVCRGDSVFTAGLLHDIGHQVMFSECPELSRQALQLSLDKDDGRSTWKAEREVFGFDHTQVGAALADLWHFPDVLRNAIQFHHSPFDHDECGDIAKVVHVANSLAVLAELDSKNFDDAPPIDERAITEFGLDAELMFGIVESTKEGASEFLRVFLN